MNVGMESPVRHRYRGCPLSASIACSLTVAMASAAQEIGVSVGSDRAELSEYLALLGSVAPAAREGAERYLIAFRARCGRTMDATGLRNAVSDGNGDPTLMAMIRAAALRDAASLDRLSATLACAGS